MSKNAEIYVDPKAYDSVAENPDPDPTIYGVETKDAKIVTWYGENGNIFLMIDNISIEMSQEKLFLLTKVLENSSLILLGINKDENQSE